MGKVYVFDEKRGIHTLFKHHSEEDDYVLDISLKIKVDLYDNKRLQKIRSAIMAAVNDYLNKTLKEKNCNFMAKSSSESKQVEEALPLQLKDLIIVVKSNINNGKYDEAKSQIMSLVHNYASSPIPFNLLGIIEEFKGETKLAQKYYRVALDLDPTYHPAIDNLHRISVYYSDLEINFGDSLE